ncbi:MAG: hypothetical protein RBQ81_01820 [Arcobacteraceae bacterium]|nr:hypothetical protein [Arcobacteraceae bacterium]MDY0364581.1 hypothetical protein [Arcobacteraceae bacterium]
MELSIDSLSKTVGVSQTTLYNYIEYLHKAELLRHIVFEGKRFKVLRMPNKLYISNTNLLKSLTLNSNIETLRETFLASQLSYNCSLYYIKALIEPINRYILHLNQSLKLYEYSYKNLL